MGTAPGAGAAAVRELEVGGLTFDAAFDSGNCARVERLGEHEFGIWTAPDCVGTSCETNNRTWFHFSVSHATAGRVLTFVVHNMNSQNRLFKHGMRPVWRTLPSRPQWERVLHPVVAAGTKAEDNFTIRFRHTIESSETHFFALCYPQPYAETCSRLAHLDALFGLPPASAEIMPPSRLGGGDTAGECDALPRTPQKCEGLEKETRKGGGVGVLTAADGLVEEASVRCASHGLPCRRPPGVYYMRELLVRSLGGRRVDLLTLSGSDGMLEEEEERLEGLFPEGRPRPRLFRDKKVVFVSARVHPGEVPASHVFDGVLSFLLREADPRARRLREAFVFKLVPCLNPDGVADGHYRADTRGLNLNRVYLDSSLEAHPSVHGVAEVIKQLHGRGELHLYVDLHAHANKRGCFLFGNALPSAQQVENVLYAKLVALNSRWVDFNGCDFSARNMSRKDRRDGKSKEGSGRVGVFTMTGLTHVYTLECSYNEGRLVNKLQPVQLPACKRDAAAISPPPSPPRGAALKYTPAHWRDVGKALALAALDLHDINPASRLPAVGGLEKQRGIVAAWVRTQARKEAARAAARAAKAAANGEGEDEDEDEEDDEDDEDEDGSPGRRGAAATAIARPPRRGVGRGSARGRARGDGKRAAAQRPPRRPG